MKITEVIYFGFELNLLEAHLALHEDMMDHIIVVECGRTTTGVPKPLLFEENKKYFNKYFVEHIILPDDTYPVETKTFLEFKHQDPNGKNIIHPYASFDADWVFHNDTDEILDSLAWYTGTKKMATLTDEVQCVHHHLDQRSPYVNTMYGLFHVHRIFRAGAKIPAPKSVKRASLIDNEPDGSSGYHFTSCFSNEEELYWKIKTRNWLFPEKTMRECEEIYLAFQENRLDEPEFADIREIFPKVKPINMTNDVPWFIRENQEMFPVHP